MTRRRRWITAGVLLGLGALSVLDHAGVFGYRGDDRQDYHGATATVTYAADGDTIDVDIPDGRRRVTRIRLWGVDCPETAHEKGRQDAYFGRQATDFVRQEVVGRRVRLELEPNHRSRDKYGRLLAYVYLAETGQMLNEVLITRGLAYADRRFPHVFKHRFAGLEKKAVKHKAGLWAGVTPQQMPAWRQRMDAAGAW
jgi:micrococcal nuclease